jgi:hypothetical protein
MGKFKKRYNLMTQIDNLVTFDSFCNNQER